MTLLQLGILILLLIPLVLFLLSEFYAQREWKDLQAEKIEDQHELRELLADEIRRMKLKQEFEDQSG